MTKIIIRINLAMLGDVFLFKCSRQVNPGLANGVNYMDM